MSTDQTMGANQAPLPSVGKAGNLVRYKTAQDHNNSYATALAELRAGKKQSHWMWFVFPQIAGLSTSPTAQFYGIRDRQEAEDYFVDPVLGRRLRESVEAMLEWTGRRSAEKILGAVDTAKFQSCLTLFEAISSDPQMRMALDLFFVGQQDKRTLTLLRQ